MSRPAIAVAALAITIAGAILLPRAFDSDSGSSEPERPAGVTTGPPSTAPPSGPVADDLAVLRRPRRPADALPGDIDKALGDDAPARERWAPELGESRRAPAGPRAAWAIPGHGYVCLVVNARSKFSFDCETVRRTRSGELLMVVEDHGVRTITGLVPDATAVVLLETAGRHTQRLAVRDNAYGTVLTADPVRLSFRPRGRRTAVVDLGP